jgi:RHH-type rel operon transcriptional repressor/antitoxin RelB
MATSVRLSPDLTKRLDFLAKQTGRSQAFYLREMIENGLDDLEDYYLASAVVERIRKGEERVDSAASVRAELGLDD